MTIAKTYRADIDGLRSLAVVSVILYHLNVPLFSGGFVGVDVFFVISGYLITSIIRSEVDQGVFSYLGFYKRRALRILPLLFAVLISSLIFGAILMTPQDFVTLSKSTFATLAFGSNIFFYKTVDYFASNDINPLLHTWSLAIEEQFYFAFPFVFAVVAKYSRAYALPIFGVLAFISFAFSVRAINESPMLAFYAPHLRAWELLIGSLIALYSSKLFQGKLTANAAGLCGLLAIVYAIFIYSEETAFPGMAAVVPTIGCALIILSGSNSLAGLLLANRILRTIGILSYSLYLWHWPVIKFFEYFRVFPLTPADKIICVILTIALSLASYFLVEKPVRYGRTREKYRLLGIGSVALFLAGCASVIFATNGVPARLSTDALRYADMTDKRTFFEIYDRGGCFLDDNQKAQDYRVPDCIPPDGTDVLIWGDSFAAHLYPGLQAARNLRVAQFTGTSCRPMLTGSRRCDQIYERFPDVIKTATPRFTVIAGYWGPTVARLGRDAFISALRTSIRLAKANSKHVVLVGQSPTYDVRLSYLGFLSSEYRQDGVVKLSAKDWTELNRTIEHIAYEEDVMFYDFYAECDKITCPAFVDGEPLHWDNGHMTLAGSQLYTSKLTYHLLDVIGSNEP